MPYILDTELKRVLAERIHYYNELGIYDFYRREPMPNLGGDATNPEIQPQPREPLTPRTRAGVAGPVIREEDLFEVANPKPESGVVDPAQALRLIREDLGD